MIAGIDIGYSHVKFIAPGVVGKFPSAVGNAERERFSLAGTETDAVAVDDGEFLVGNAALLSSRFATRREDRDWINSMHYRVLFAATLTGLTAAKYARLQVVTGLPVTYLSDRADLVERLRSAWRVRRDGRHWQTVDVTAVAVLPQPFGALLDVALDANGKIADATVATGRIGVIDIGGKTTGFLTVDRLREVPAQTGSIDTGAWDALTLARDAINTRYPGLELDDYAISAAAQGDSVRYFGDEMDVRNLIADALCPLADRVIGEATARWGTGARLDAILVAGGGAHLVGSAILSQYRHARIAQSPSKANALGYYKYGRRLWKQNQKNGTNDSE